MKHWRIGEHVLLDGDVNESEAFQIEDETGQLIALVKAREIRTSIRHDRLAHAFAEFIAGAPEMYNALDALIKHRQKEYLDNTVEPYASCARVLKKVTPQV